MVAAMKSNANNTSAVAAPEPAFLTTREVAELLRVRERKVYDLAAAGEIPCRKVTGKLLFPKQEIEDWLNAGAEPPATANPAFAAAPQSPPPSVFVGSHDPLLEWALRASGCETPTLFGGSMDGLARILRGEATAAALHIFDPETEDWNAPALTRADLSRPFALIAFAKRRQGLIWPRAAQELKSVADLKGRSVILRQKAAGGRLLLESLLERAGMSLKDLTPTAEEARSESDAAEAVADGRAEATLGLEAMAKRYDLGFTPLIEERFDLLIEHGAYFEQPLQKLLGFLRSDTFRARAADIGGYDVSDCGAVRWTRR